MAGASFDPDAYLSQKSATTAQSFDPDAYLSQKSQPDQPEQKTDVPWYQLENPTARKWAKSALESLPLAGTIVGGVLGTPADAVAGPLGNVAGAAAGGATGAALKNAGERALLGEDKTRSELYGGPLRAGAEGATAEVGGQLVGKALETAAQSPAGQFVLRKAGDAATAVPQWAAQKVGRVLADVPEETTARYLQNPSVINNAPTRDQISDRIMNLKSQAEDGLTKAQEEFLTAKAAAGDAKSDVRSGLQDQKFQSSADLQQAQQAFNDKKQALKEALKGQNLTSMAGDVHDAIGDLKDQVVQGSKDAYDTLHKARGEVSTKPLVNLLQNHIDSMTVNGVAASKSAEQAISEIQAMQNRLGQMGDTVSMPSAKQILQGLDKDISYSNQAGTFAPQTDQAFSALRHAIDQDVKTQVPEYAAKMSDVSRKARLLNSASDTFGTPEKAISNLNNIASDRGQAIHLPMIDALGTETGRDLSTPVGKYVSTQKILSTPSLFEKYINEMPEAQALNSAQSRMNEISNPSYSRSSVQNVAEQSGKRLSAAEVAKDAAKEKADLFKGVSAQNVTSKTKALNGANSYGADATLAPIDEAYGTDFRNQIQSRNDADQFQKDTTHGSRKSIVGATLGGLTGYLTGGIEHGFIGAEVGAAAGAAADKYSGKVFKYGLDKGMSVGSKLSNAADEAAATLKAAPAIQGQGATSLVPSQMPLPSAAANDEKGPNKWAKDGLQALRAHSTDDDKALLDKYKDTMMADPKAKQLLTVASNFPPGSKPLDDIIKHLKKRIGEDSK